MCQNLPHLSSLIIAILSTNLYLIFFIKYNESMTSHKATRALPQIITLILFATTAGCKLIGNSSSETSANAATAPSKTDSTTSTTTTTTTTTTPTPTPTPSATTASLAAPTALGVTVTSHTQTHLIWTDNSDNETGFEVWRKTGSGAFSLLTTTIANATNYTDSTATANTSYAYKVRAVNDTSHSNDTSEISVSTPASLLGTGIVGDGYKLANGSGASTCSAYLTSEQYAAQGSAIYKINPSGSSEFEVYCNMVDSGDGAGWALVVRANREGATGLNTNSAFGGVPTVGGGSAKISHQEIQNLVTLSTLANAVKIEFPDIAISKYIHSGCTWQHPADRKSVV